MDNLYPLTGKEFLLIFLLEAIVGLLNCVMTSIVVTTKE